MTNPDDVIRFRVPGDPRGQGRAKHARRGDMIMTYKQKKDVEYERHIRACYIEKFGMGEPPFDDDAPLAVGYRAECRMPKSMPKWRERIIAEFEAGPHEADPDKWPREIFRIKTPDFDNIWKSIADAGNGLIWPDDRQIVLSRDASTIYTRGEPSLIIWVYELGV